MTSLRRGDRGPRVVELQRAITAATDIALAPDGVFGEQTEQAVRVYQFGKGLVRDGIAGPITLRALGLDAPPSSAPPTKPTGAPPLAPIPAGWIMGVDTSRAQGVLDAPLLVRAGVSFLFAKATDGINSTDPQWARTVAACQAAGLPVGGYGVLEPYGRAKVELQALHFAATLKAAGPLDLPPVCDFELAAGQSGLDALASAAAWCDLVEASLGRRVILYTGPAFFDLLARYAGPSGDAITARLATRPLWIAHYGRALTRGPNVPRAWSDWTIWQASGDDGAKIPGTKRAIDVDYFRGTIEDLIALGALA